MHFNNFLSAALSLAYLSVTTATATNLDLVSPDALYNPGLLKRGWSMFDTRQEPSQPPPANPNDPSAPRLVQVVRVSDNNGTLRFFPDKVKANVGDVVQFHFYPKNHTITESLFAQPCMPLPQENATETRPGQKSGFVPVAPDAQFRPIYNVILNDTKPMWIFCGQKPHCQKGMVMVINQNETSTDKTLEIYRANAMALLAAGAPPAGGSTSAPPAPAGTPPPGPSAPPAASGTGAPSAPPSPPPASTVTPAGQSGPSLLGSQTATASASIASFSGFANKDLQAWGSSWSVGLVGLAGVGMLL